MFSDCGKTHRLAETQISKKAIPKPLSTAWSSSADSFWPPLQKQFGLPTVRGCASLLARQVDSSCSFPAARPGTSKQCLYSFTGAGRYDVGSRSGHSKWWNVLHFVSDSGSGSERRENTEDATQRSESRTSGQRRLINVADVKKEETLTCLASKCDV